MIIKSLSESPVPIRHLGAFWGPAMTLNIEDPAALHVSTVTVLGTELPGARRGTAARRPRHAAPSIGQGACAQRVPRRGKGPPPWRLLNLRRCVPLRMRSAAHWQ